MKTISIFFIKKFIPLLNKIANNAYVKALFRAQEQVLPMVFIGSIITFYSIVQKYYSFLPNLELISKVTYGLMAIYMAYLVPFHLLSVHKKERYSSIGGFTGISAYVLLIYDTLVSKDGTFDFRMFGAEGTLLALAVGFLTVGIFLFFGLHPFQAKTPYGRYIEEKGIHYIPPILTAIFVVFLFNITIKADLYRGILVAVSALSSLSGSAVGFSFFVFVPAVLHSIGANSWTYASIIEPLVISAPTIGSQIVESRGILHNTLVPYIYLGGHASALGLMILFLFSKVQKIRHYGKIFIVPGIFNIGEPILYSMIVWNPIFMVPMWLNAIILPFITYFFIHWGIVPAPVEAFTSWYIPIGINAVLATQSYSSLILVAVNLFVSTAVWYPFFKVYEKSVLADDEGKKEEDGRKIPVQAQLSRKDALETR